MPNFKPNKQHLRHVLLFAFNSKKSAAKARRMIVETYGEEAISERTCREWFQRFKSGDFDVEDKERPGPVKQFEDAQLRELLKQDPCQSQKDLAHSLGVTRQAISHRFKALGIVRKQGNWVTCKPELTDIEESSVLPEELPQKREMESAQIPKS